MKAIIILIGLLFFSSCSNIMDSVTSYALESEESSYSTSCKAGVEKPRTWDKVNYIKKENYILDKKQHLMWENSSNVSVKKSYVNAKKSCENLSIGGYHDWRLPTLNEVINILDYTHYANVYPSDDFGYLLVTCYGEGPERRCENIIWTDTFTSYNKNNKTQAGVYVVDIVNGFISTEDSLTGYLSIKHTARCVRNY